MYCKELNSTTLSYYGLQLKRSFTNQFLLSTNGNNYHEKNCSTDYSKLQLRSKRNCLTWYHIDLRRTSAKEIHRNRVLRGREIFFFICSYISELNQNQVWSLTYARRNFLRLDHLSLRKCYTSKETRCFTIKAVISLTN